MAIGTRLQTLNFSNGKNTMPPLVKLSAKDSKGRYVRSKGHEKKPSGLIEQHKFILGKDRADAEVRFLRLDAVWDAVEKRWLLGGRKTDRPYWDNVSLKIGLAVARGEETVTFSAWELLD